MSKILVIGESSKDIFVYCHALRLAPDLPVPVLQVATQTENPGMAMNVWRNIISLGGTAEIETNSNWKSITKTRYMHNLSNHMFLRVDSEAIMEPLDVTTIDFEYDAIVISDYNKGFISEDMIRDICNKHSLVFIDTKKKLGDWALGAKFIKINDYEYKRSKPFLSAELEEKIIHTKGASGCEYLGKTFEVEPCEVKDTSGAGDTFMAGLVVSYMNGNSINSAIEYANECASRVVRKKGVTLP